MLNGKSVAVVVPAYNEEDQITHVIESMPAFVDRIIIVDDFSRDRTSEVIRALLPRFGSSLRLDRASAPPDTRFNEAERVVHEMNEKELEYFVPSEILNQSPETDRVILIRLLKNGGVGAAIARGYKWCKDHEIDCTAVMAGDGQMDPGELESICRPVIDEGIDYVKGNRLIHRSAWLVIPRIRYFGNSALSLMTKIATGYWYVSDTQTGYTAISKAALSSIRLYDIFPRYGMPNDMLVKLNIALCTLREVPIKPVYRVGEQSKMKIKKVIFTISFLLFKSFFKRLWIKYFFRDFHPLFLLYNFCFVLLLGIIPLGARLISEWYSGQSWTLVSIICFTLLSLSFFQSLMFAMWMDVLDNQRLYK